MTKKTEKLNKAKQRVREIQEAAPYAADLRECLVQLLEVVGEVIDAATDEPTEPATAAPAKRTSKTSK